MGPTPVPFTTTFCPLILQWRTIADAVLRSQTFQQWKEQNVGRLEEDMTRKEMANLFLDEVHMTHYDIQKAIDGRELWEKDRGDEDRPTKRG